MAETWFETYAELDVPSLTGVALEGSTRLGVQTQVSASEPRREQPSIEGYELRRLLGEGGQGTVFLATHLASGQDVALKWIHRRDLRAVATLKEEFRSLSRLDHPNIVRLHELVVSPELGYLTMEYVPGAPLVRSLRSRGGEEGAIRLAFAQLALAIAATHEEGLLHGDISGRNVQRRPDGRVVLLDFGLVRRARDQYGEPGVVRGTPAYMAPEQLRGEAASRASDWYAFGTLLFRILTGNLPFTRGSDFDLAAKLHDDPPLCSRLRPGLPLDLERLCAALMAREAEERPSGDEIVARLGAASLGRPERGSTLVGRGRELEALAAAFERARVGGTVVVRVFGEAGVGKSALVGDFVESVRDDAVVLRSRCDARAQVPFRALDELFDEAARCVGGDPLLTTLREEGAWRTLGRLFPPLAPSGAQEAGERDAREVVEGAVTDARSLLRSLAPAKPVVLCLDDVQWSDSDSVPLLLGLLTSPVPGLLLIVACRQQGRRPEANPLLRAMDGVRSRVDVTTVELGPLAMEDAALLLGSGLAPDEVRQLHARCAGNPLLLTELRHHAQLRAFLASAPDERIPYAQQVLGRVAHLGDGERRVLEWVALAGGPLPAGLLPDEAAESLAALRRLETVVMDPRARWALAHDRDREVIVDALLPSARRRRHRELAARYAEVAPHDHEALAFHLASGGERYRAAPHQIEAAARAWDAFAFDRASAWLTKARDTLAIFDPVAAADLEPRLAEAYARAGRLTEAWELFEHCGRRASGGDGATYLRRSVEHRLTSGDYAGALAPLRQLLREHDLPTLEEQTQAFAYIGVELARALRRLLWRRRRRPRSWPRDEERLLTCLTALRGFTTYDTYRGAAYTFIYLRLALDTDDPSHIALAAAYGAVMMSVSGAPALEGLGRRLMALARAEAQRSGEPDLVAAVQMARDEQRLFGGEWGAADAIARILPAVSRRGRYGAERDTAEQVRMIGLERMGELRRLEQEAYLRHGEGQARLVPAAVGKNAGWLAYCALGRGDVAAARAHARVSVSALPTHAYLFAHWLAWRASCFCALYEGQGVEALRRVEREVPALAASGLLQLTFVRVPTLVLRSAAHRGAGVAAPRDLLRAGEGLQDHELPYARAAGHLLAFHTGDDPLALARAEEAFGEAGMRLASLTCRWARSPADRHDVRAAMAELGVAEPDRWARLLGLGAPS